MFFGGLASTEGDLPDRENKPSFFSVGSRVSLSLLTCVSEGCGYCRQQGVEQVSPPDWGGSGSSPANPPTRNDNNGNGDDTALGCGAWMCVRVCDNCKGGQKIPNRLVRVFFARGVAQAFAMKSTGLGWQGSTGDLDLEMGLQLTCNFNGVGSQPNRKQ